MNVDQASPPIATTMFANLYYGLAMAHEFKRVSTKEMREALAFFRPFRCRAVSPQTFFEGRWMPFTVFFTLHKMRMFIGSLAK